VKRGLVGALSSICFIAAVGFSQAIKQEPQTTQTTSDSDTFVKLNPTGPQTITAGPLNIIATPDNPTLQCTLCMRDRSTDTHAGGVEFEMFSRSGIPGNFPSHFVANYWGPPDGASVGNYYPVYFSTEGDGNATYATYRGAVFDSGNGGGQSPVYVNWEGVRINLVNVTSQGPGVTVPGHLYGLNVHMPGIVGGLVSAGVNVEGLADPKNLAFYTPRGRFVTSNGDILAPGGTVGGKMLQASGSATWTAANGEPLQDTCVTFGSLYSRTDAPDSSHALYVCTPEGWVAK